MSIENNLPEQEKKEGGTLVTQLEGTTIESVEMNNEQVLEHAVGVEKKIEREAAEAVLEAEKIIKNSATSMGVSDEMLVATRKEEGVDDQMVALQSEANELAEEAKQEIEEVASRDLIVHETETKSVYEDGVERNEYGQTKATVEEMEMLKQWEEDHPEVYTQGDTFTQSTLEVASQGILEFRNMVTEFEAVYPLDELFAIVDLSASPDYKHPLRDLAKKALNPILAKLDALREDTSVTAEEYEELEKQWKILSNAVGMVNRGMVDHTR